MWLAKIGVYPVKRKSPPSRAGPNLALVLQSVLDAICRVRIALNLPAFQRTQHFSFRTGNSPVEAPSSEWHAVSKDHDR